MSKKEAREGPASPGAAAEQTTDFLSCPQDSHPLVEGLRWGGPESAQALWDPL